MSKSSELDQKYKLFILEAIDPIPYGSEAVTHAELAAFVFESFESEAGFNLARYGSQKAVAEWLAGLPSIVNIPFENMEILRLAVRFGSLPKEYKEKQADKILENYFSFMATKLCQLIDGYRVPDDTTHAMLERVEAYQEDTKAISSEEQLSELFDSDILPLIIEQYSADDQLAINEGFNDWADGLCKDDQLHDLQYDQYCYVGTAR